MQVARMPDLFSADAAHLQIGYNEIGWREMIKAVYE